MNEQRSVDLSRVRALSFDLDDTLWAVVPVIRRAEAALQQWLITHFPDTRHFFATHTVLSLREEVFADFPDRHHDLSFLRQECIGRILERCGYTRDGVEGAFEAFTFARNTIELFDDVEPFFTEVAPNYTCVALTNGNACVKRTPLNNVFDTYINAIAAGAAKPQPHMFEAALQAHELEPHEMLHIGDDLVTDVKGAAQLGIPTVWVNRFSRSWSSNHHPPDYVVNSLVQLRHILHGASEQPRAKFSPRPDKA